MRTRKTRKFTASVWQEGDWFIAQCLEVDVASQGVNEQDALENLKEALALYFEPPLATSAPSVHRFDVNFYGS